LVGSPAYLALLASLASFAALAWLEDKDVEELHAEEEHTALALAPL
jgi:hypothetical protein